MPTVTNMVIDGIIPLPDVTGKVTLLDRRVKVSEQLDGSSLNLTAVPHRIIFSVPKKLLPRVNESLRYNAAILFSARYSTGERLAKAPALVEAVDLMEDGEMRFTLVVGPDAAVLRNDALGSV